MIKGDTPEMQDEEEETVEEPIPFRDTHFFLFFIYNIPESLSRCTAPFHLSRCHTGPEYR